MTQDRSLLPEYPTRFTLRGMKRVSIAALAAISLLAAVLAGCGDGESQATTTSAATTTIAPDLTTTEPEPSTSSTDDTSPTTNDTSVPETTDPPGETTTTLPGTEVEMFAREGDILHVVGVAHDDVLNVRSGPSAGFDIVTTLQPTGNATATGRARQIPGAFWYEVEANGQTGWANMRFFAYLGGVGDATSQIVNELDGVIPEAETMLDLGQLVAEAYPRDESVEPKITMTVAPTVGDLGEVTFDVIGLADDSLLGVRLHVFGQPTEGGDGFGLKSVEATSLCGRGLSGELCV